MYNSPTCIPPDTAFFALNRLYTAHLHRESISLHDQYHLKPTVKQISLESCRFTQHGDRPFDLWLYAWDSHHMETAYVTCDYRPEIHTAWKPPMWLVIICLSFPPHRDRLCDLWLLAGVSHHMETAYVTCDYRPEIHTAWKPPMWLVIICLSFPPHRDRLCDLWLLAGVSHHMETAYVTHKHNMYGN